MVDETDNQGGEALVVTRTLQELLDEGRLPSGGTFTLMPDTVGTGLAVAEAADSAQWREKALQVLAVVDKIDGESVRDNGGVDFIRSLPDTDVSFLALAWSCQSTGGSLSLGEGAPCPYCAHKIKKFSMSGLGVVCAAPGKSSGFVPVEMPEGCAPARFKDGQFMVKMPTWFDARSNIPEVSYDKFEVLHIHRAMAALYFQGKGEPAPRKIMSTEIKTKFKLPAIRAVMKTLRESTPHILDAISIECPSCKQEVETPFEQAMG